jgi:hypothetical protein
MLLRLGRLRKVIRRSRQRVVVFGLAEVGGCK